MTKVIHIGDLHLDENHPEKSTASVEFLINSICNSESQAYLPDLIVCTGDSTQRKIHVSSDLIRPLIKLVDTVPCPLIFLQGTPFHEPYGFLSNLREASGNRFYAIINPVIHIPRSPNKELCRFGNVPLAIMAIPALTRVGIQEWGKTILGDNDGEIDIIIPNLIKHFSSAWDNFPGTKIMLGHWTVAGCTTSTGHVLHGGDLTISLEDIALCGADAVLLGHIHKAQSWSEPVFVSYCGSSYPTNWGELDQKSFSVLEFDEHTGKLVNFSRVPYPHKPMAKVELEFTGEQKDGEWDWHHLNGDPSTTTYYDLLADKEIKACYSVPKEIAGQVDDIYVRLLFKRVYGVDVAAVDRIIKASDRSRMPDIGDKQTTRDQYLAVCEVKGEEPRPGSIEIADLLDEKGVGR